MKRTNHHANDVLGIADIFLEIIFEGLRSHVKDPLVSKVFLS